MKYEYLGSSKRTVHTKSKGIIALKRGDVFEVDEEINHPLIVRVTQRKAGGRYNVKTTH